ncbi:hypothetical protein MASR2M39_25390 [Ignavibacteriales bacterium]
MDDYVDDYRARAEYANWLNGAPAGPNKQKDNEGLKIPVDLTMAWRAGILGGDYQLIWHSDDLQFFWDGYYNFSRRQKQNGEQRPG